jgi:serine/threonine-protein kinase
MSPEQLVASKDVDLRTDIWALGVILYELITGVHPFDAELLPQICTLVMQSEPRSMREIRPDIPDGLQAAVVRCLEKERERRWQSVAELAAAIAPFGTRACASLVESMARARILTSEPPPAGAVALASVAPAVRTALTSSADVVAQPGRRLLPAVAGVALLVLSAASLWIWIGVSRGTTKSNAGIVGGVDLTLPASSPLSAAVPLVSAAPAEQPSSAYAGNSAIVPSASAPRPAPAPVRTQGTPAPVPSGPKPANTGSKRGLDMFNDTE